MNEDSLNTSNKGGFLKSLFSKNRLPNFTQDYYKRLREIYKDEGKEAFENELASHKLEAYQYANVCIEIAKLMSKSEKNLIRDLALASWQADPKIYRLKWLIFRIEESGNYVKSAHFLELLPKDVKLSESEKTRIEKIIDNVKKADLFKKTTKDSNYLKNQDCLELLDTCMLQEDELKRVVNDLRELYLREDKLKIENERLKSELRKYTNID